MFRLRKTTLALAALFFALSAGQTSHAQQNPISQPAEQEPSFSVSVADEEAPAPNVVAASAVLPGQLIISECRFLGPGGSLDEFIEIYNNTDSNIVVDSDGFAVVASDGITRFIIPVGTPIPARGHYLGVNSNGYSLGGYPAGNATTATPDATYTADIPDNSTAGVAIFNSSTPANFTQANRLDAFGFGGAPQLYREGAGFSPLNPNASEVSYVRNIIGVQDGRPKDTDNNQGDFQVINSDIAIYNTGKLGAPGPENLSSPVLMNNLFPMQGLDPSVSSDQLPNRERRSIVEPNANFGTLIIRRTLTNRTTQPITRLRFRIVDITTFGTPASCGAGGTSICADLRALDSPDEPGIATSTGPKSTGGLTVEIPPAQPSGGGYNTSMNVRQVNLATPLLPGQMININFKLGVMRTGSYRFFVNVEGLQAAVAPPL